MSKNNRIKKWFKNLFFCLKYPFWKYRNTWTGKTIGYNHTWYDEIEEGWRIAFGKALSDDIKRAGKATRKRLHKYIRWKNLISFQQIKEKWGELCIYASASDEIEKVLRYYELLSQGYCFRCGKPARYLTKGWVEYVCEDCFDKYLKDHNYTEEEIKKAKQNCKLTRRDSPRLTNYEYVTQEIEYFDSGEAQEKRFDELWKIKHEEDNGFVYHKKYENNKFIIEHVRVITHDVDIKKEYNIDFEDLWGLKND